MPETSKVKHTSASEFSAALAEYMEHPERRDQIYRDAEQSFQDARLVWKDLRDRGAPAPEKALSWVAERPVVYVPLVGIMAVGMGLTVYKIVQGAISAFKWVRGYFGGGAGL